MNIETAIITVMVLVSGIENSLIVCHKELKH